MRIFLAGATGVIGIRLLPLLAADGHTVAGMTRSPEKVDQLRALGAEPVVCDALDAPALIEAVTAFAPEAILHQVTDLPDRLDQLPAFAERNDRIRTEGTGNLVAAARRAGAGHFLAQSIAWRPRAAAVRSTNTSASCSRFVALWFATDSCTAPEPSTRLSFRRTRGSTLTTPLDARLR